MEQVKEEVCSVCGLPRSSELEYCVEHAAALERVVSGYQVWSKAYGGISRDDYLTKLSKLAETGERALQVAAFLSKNPSRWPI